MKKHIGLLAWGAAVLAGFAALVVDSTKPAKLHERAVTQWPSAVNWSHSQDTLVVFLHPKCGCSRATLAELETMLPSLDQKVHVILDFYFPSNEGEHFVEGRLMEIAKRFPNVEIKTDKDAETADLFLARASGEVLYFDKAGALKFHGGLTPLRGHGGDSVGRRAVLALAQGQTPDVESSRVFGCQLKEELANEVALVQ